MQSKETLLKKYYENPSICKYCGKILEVPENGRIFDTKRKQFCNNSCSAKFNNKGKIKNPKGLNGKIIDPEAYKKEICPNCGGYKDKKSKLCINCHTENKTISNKFLGQYINGEKYLTSKITSIRADARNKLERSNAKKICSLCKEFDSNLSDILEVHHIKGILQFSEDTLISEINDESNLM